MKKVHEKHQKETSDNINSLNRNCMSLMLSPKNEVVSGKQLTHTKLNIKDVSHILEHINNTKMDPPENEKEECIVCYTNNPDAVLMPCGHGGICYDCALSVWENDVGCYLCRMEITEVYQIGKNKNKYCDVVASTKLIRCDEFGNPIDENGNKIEKKNGAVEEEEEEKKEDN